MIIRVSIVRPRIPVVSVTHGFWTYVSPVLDKYCDFVDNFGHYKGNELVMTGLNVSAVC